MSRHMSGNGEAIVDISKYEGVIRVSRGTKSNIEPSVFPKVDAGETLNLVSVSHTGQYVAFGLHRRSGIEVDRKDAKNFHKEYIGKLVIVPLVAKQTACQDSVYHSSLISDLQFSRDERFLVSASWNGRAVVFNTRCAHAATFYVTECFLYNAAISRDGDRVVTADARSARIWKMPKDYDGQSLGFGECDKTSYDGLSVYILCISRSGHGRLYDAGEGRNLGELDPAFPNPKQGAFSADGKIVSVVYADGNIVFWNAGSRKLVGILRIFTEREWLFVDERGRYCGTDGTERFLRIEEVAPGYLWNSTRSRMLEDKDRLRLRDNCAAIWPVT